MIMIKDLKTEFSNDLEYHDWFYDFSDDHSVWKKGFNAHDKVKSEFFCVCVV